jgi:ABC-2 type transport system permease protein
MWRLVARKDVRDAIRERQLHVGVGLFLVVGLLAGFMYGDSIPRTAPGDPGLGFLGILVGASLFLVPITALMYAQGRIVDKRSRGELVVLLGMPFSRRDVVLGSLAGRVAITSIVLAVFYAAATGVAALMLAPIPLGRILAFLAVFAVFGGLFVAIGTALSAGLSGTTRAAIGAVGVYLFFLFRIHDLVWSLTLSAVYGSRGVPETLGVLAVQFGPFTALRNVVVGVYPEIAGAFGYFGGTPPTELTLAATPAVGLVVLVAWTVGPLYLGLRRFEGADL